MTIEYERKLKADAAALGEFIKTPASSYQDDLKLYHETLLAQLIADEKDTQWYSPRMLAQRFRKAWDAVDADRERRSKEWLRSKGLGDLTDDAPAEEPVPEGMRVCTCADGEAYRQFCDCPVEPPSELQT